MLEWATTAVENQRDPFDRRPVHGYRRAGGRAGTAAARRHRHRGRRFADALRYARRNAAGTAVELVEADVTEPGLLPDLDGRVDLLVCQPAVHS